MTWNINDAAARQVCVDTETAAQELDTVAFTVADAFGSASADMGSDTFAALNDVAADPFLIRLASMRRMVQYVTDATDSVISIYAEGNLRMAAETQSTMSGLEL